MILYLTNVARPVICQNGLFTITGKFELLAAVSIAVDFEKVPCKQEGIFSPLPDRRDLDGKYVQAVVEVFTEGAAIYSIFKVNIGCRYNTYVNLHRF